MPIYKNPIKKAQRKSNQNTMPTHNNARHKNNKNTVVHMDTQKLLWTTKQALKFASANKFAYFSAREGPPASIFHENFEISDFMTDLGRKNSSVKQIFPDTTPRPKC